MAFVYNHPFDRLYGRTAASVRLRGSANIGQRGGEKYARNYSDYSWLSNVAATRLCTGRPETPKIMR